MGGGVSRGWEMDGEGVGVTLICPQNKCAHSGASPADKSFHQCNYMFLAPIWNQKSRIACDMTYTIGAEGKTCAPHKMAERLSRQMF